MTIRSAHRLWVFGVVALLFAPDANAGDCVDLSSPDIWMLKSRGTWTDGDDYGHYRVVVYRKTGRDHSQDRVQVQITQAKERLRVAVRCIDLDTPGLKGYVRDIRIQPVNDQAAAIELSIEMKAMEGVILQDVFLVAAAGRVEKILDASKVRGSV